MHKGQRFTARAAKLEYVIVNGAAFLVKRGDYLCEAPLSYYPRNRSWGLSPGYEHNDTAFNRPIEAGCISCPSGRPQPVADRPGLFQSPPFLEEAIGARTATDPGIARLGGAKGVRVLEAPIR